MSRGVPEGSDAHSPNFLGMWLMSTLTCRFFLCFTLSSLGWAGGGRSILAQDCCNLELYVFEEDEGNMRLGLHFGPDRCGLPGAGGG